MTLWLVLLHGWTIPLMAGPTPAPTSRPVAQTQAAPKAAKRTKRTKQTPKTTPSSRPVAARHNPSPTPPPVRLALRAKPLPPGSRPPTDVATRPRKPTPTIRSPFRKMKQGSFFWSRVFGMLFALGVVIIAIFVALRWAAQRMGVYTPSKDKQMVIRDRLSLEQKKGLYLVELAGQSYLLATHEQGVTLLDKRPTDALQHKDAPIPTQFEVVSDGSSKTTQQE